MMPVGLLVDGWAEAAKEVGPHICRSHNAILRSSAPTKGKVGSYFPGNSCRNGTN
jgi:hypothetical protein